MESEKDEGIFVELKSQRREGRRPREHIGFLLCFQALCRYRSSGRFEPTRPNAVGPLQALPHLELLPCCTLQAAYF